MRRMTITLAATIIAVQGTLAGPKEVDSTAAERGYKALTSRAFLSAAWPESAYDRVWKFWGVRDKPADYDAAFRGRYGLHPAPFANGRYPMGLRKGKLLAATGLTTDCLLCHGGSILGKSYIGLGNATLDMELLFKELFQASGRSGKLPLTFTRVRGTTEAANFSVFLLRYRNPDLTLRLNPAPLPLGPVFCEDVPAWWLLKKKKTMYHTGAISAKSVRSIMQFLLASTNTPADFAREEATFQDIRAFLCSLEPPKYPFPIDKRLADAGKKIFEKRCARCHGTYGEDWTYPNRIVPLEVIGTDPSRLRNLRREWMEYYNRSWFAREVEGWFGHEYRARETRGYQAPPLDGIWATAPYFHNGSVPTLYDVLNSRSRPAIYTRSFRTDVEAYDQEKVGWKVQVLERGADPSLPDHEQRKVYDTRLPGRSNRGHTFGDALSERERRAVIEYLKTL